MRRLAKVVMGLLLVAALFATQRDITGIIARLDNDCFGTGQFSDTDIINYKDIGFVHATSANSATVQHGHLAVGCSGTHFLLVMMLSAMWCASIALMCYVLYCTASVILE